jgi:hypothetical protein
MTMADENDTGGGEELVIEEFGQNEPDDNQPEQREEGPEDYGLDDDEPQARDKNTQDDDPEEEWEAGGQKFRVKKSELRAGYMKDADYRQKTAKVAEQYRAADQVIQRVTMEHQQRANHLDVFMQSLQRELVGSQPDPRLIDENPQEFLRQTAQYNQRAQLMQQAMAERQGLAQQQQAMQHQRRAQMLEAEKERLSQAIPEWRDSKAQQAEQKLIADTLSKAGYRPEEIGSIADHRAVVLARKAALYDQMMAVRSKQSPAPLPKPIRPGASGSTKTDSVASRARERLSRNPSDMNALAGLLGSSGF